MDDWTLFNYQSLLSQSQLHQKKSSVSHRPRCVLAASRLSFFSNVKSFVLPQRSAWTEPSTSTCSRPMETVTAKPSTCIWIYVTTTTSEDAAHGLVEDAAHGLVEDAANGLVEDAVLSSCRGDAQTWYWSFIRSCVCDRFSRRNQC